MRDKVLSPVSAPSPSFAKRYGLILASVLLGAIILLPPPAGLTVAAWRMIAILIFSVIVWMSEAMSYPVSAAVIVSVMAFLLGLSPDLTNPKVLMGTSNGLRIALGGFSNTAFALVAGALFIAAAMMKTGLDRRIALVVLSRVGTTPKRIIVGVIIVGFVLSFFVPSTTARVSCLVPIVMGIIIALGIDKRSRFAAVMMITTAQADSIWNVGIKTAAAQNLIAVGFIKTQLGIDLSWTYWFICAAPFAAIMSVVLYFVMVKVMPPETDEIADGNAIVRKALAELGPMKPDEKRLMVISLILLGFWVTEGSLFGLHIHPFDTSTTTIAAISVMLLPGIGVMNWKQAQENVPWGTVVVFGVGISLGSALLSTKAVSWIAQWVVTLFGLEYLSSVLIIAVLASFLIIIHLGFASATALAAAMIPIIISTMQSVKTPGINVMGMTMILQWVISFGFILPVNAPQNMVAYGTDTFEVKDFIRTGIPLTIAAYLLILLLAATYWKWMGLT
ncbi:MAG TPA: DASS family sodium-coupled anion symporter [Syntrophales bacterium]|nr:DASS family sodium-coupled anion symporter [Syntrophales bacterium]